MSSALSFIFLPGLIIFDECSACAPTSAEKPNEGTDKSKKSLKFKHIPNIKKDGQRHCDFMKLR